MEIGIVGLPQSGKRTLFTLLTQASGNLGSNKERKEQNLGVSYVFDSRLDRLAKLYQPQKKVPATIKYILVSKLSKNSEENREAFKTISSVDAICHVVRAFSDDTVFHIDGTVDPKRDIEYVESELILNDLVFVENRIQKLEKDMKRKKDVALQQECDLMRRLLDYLNQDMPLRMYQLTEEESKMLNAYPLLSRKNMLIALNVSEESVSSSECVDKLSRAYEGRGMHFVQISCKIESELLEIDDEAERRLFLDDLGIETSALEKVTRLSYEALDLISFFTVGKDEVRAWTIRAGCTAPRAGGRIHSDIERGFIRAEHMRVEDLLECGSEQKVKDCGKFSLKGKDYTVRDGDILHFRFNI